MLAQLSTSMIRATFKGSTGTELAARLDLPAGPVRGFALFAHCFTCTKEILAAKRVAAGLAAAGVGVLRFDFTGLGSSEGEFGNTNFSSNVEDLVHAAAYLRANYVAPFLLIGHSLGGSAVLAAAADIPEAKAVVTIGAPADVAHVLNQFGGSLDEIRQRGEARVTLAGRQFTIRHSFIEDAEGHRLANKIATLGKALLVMHASLDDADHLLSDATAAAYAARIIVAWASKYVPECLPDAKEATGVLVRETLQGRYQNIAVAGRHRLIADEPVSAGGLDSGPNPYDYLAIALGACTAMTLRVYAEHKKLDLGRITVAVKHGKVAAQHCMDCGEAAEGREGKIDRFDRVISIEGKVDPDLGQKLAEIAGKCPVHRTLEATSAVITKIQLQG